MEFLLPFGVMLYLIGIRAFVGWLEKRLPDSQTKRVLFKVRW